MTRATERWQETMRYAVDTGAMAPGPRRSRWPLALAAVVGTAALGLAGAASSGRGPGDRAWVDPDRPAITLASAELAAEPARKRSYTRNARRRDERGRGAGSDTLRSRCGPRAARPTGADDHGRHRARRTTRRARPTARHPLSCALPTGRGSARPCAKLGSHRSRPGLGRARSGKLPPTHAKAPASAKRSGPRRVPARSAARRGRWPWIPVPNGPARSRRQGLSASASITLSASRRVRERRKRSSPPPGDRRERDVLINSRPARPCR